MKQNPTSVPWGEALRFWLKLGFISFGGPAGQIATVHKELVENKRWISEQRFLHALNYCMLLPGPEALQLIIYMGWLFHRTLGGIVAGILFILPALLLLILLSMIYMTFGQTSLLIGIFMGIKPAVTAIVIQAAYKIGKRILKTPLQFFIAIVALIGILLQVPYPIIIIGAGLVAWLAHRFFLVSTNTLESKESSKEVKENHNSIINDQSHRLAHTHFHLKNFIKILLISITLWTIPLFVCIHIWGISGLYSQLALFFSKAALLTFGGAYAVLPYVFQSAVEQFQWLSASQMMDGLALGETTPGPLIIVVTYIGYIAAYLQSVIEHAPIFSGILGALVVSWFTFLPSFCFIFLGAPLIESTRNDFKFTVILGGISCAVTGVIASLAMFFIYHTVLPEGFRGNIFSIHALFSVALILIAMIALIKWQLSILKLLLMCSLLGIIYYFSLGL